MSSVTIIIACPNKKTNYHHDDHDDHNNDNNDNNHNNSKKSLNSNRKQQRKKIKKNTRKNQQTQKKQTSGTTVSTHYFVPVHIASPSLSARAVQKQTTQQANTKIIENKHQTTLNSE